MTPLLAAEAVHVPGRLEPLSLTSEAGTLTAIIGPNGSGKTSLLRALARIERPTGRMTIAGELVDRASPARRRALLSFLPASREVVWPISVRDVIALGLAKPDPERIAELVEMMELDPLVDRPIDRLSTGERARVLLARALAPRPHVLLLDEPLSNLDPYWILKTLDVVRLALDDRTAALVSLHDLSLLHRFDRVLLMAEGHVVASGEPNAVLNHSAFRGAFRVEPAGGGWRIAD